MDSKRNFKFFNVTNDLDFVNLEKFLLENLNNRTKLFRIENDETVKLKVLFIIIKTVVFC